MLLASGDWTSWSGWGPLGVFVAIVVGALLIWLTWKLAFSRHRITYSLQMTPLVARGSGFAAELRIFYGSDTTTPLGRPVVVAIRLASRSARDIPTSAFDNHKPLAVDLGIPVVAILGDNTAAEITGYSGNQIFIGPGLIRRNQVIRLNVLVDGQPTVRVTNPLIDVTVKERPWTSPVGPWWKDGALRQIVIAGVVVPWLPSRSVIDSLGPAGAEFARSAESCASLQSTAGVVMYAPNRLV